MSIFFNAAAQVGDKFGVNAVNSILSLFASNTAPTNPFNGQVWLDTSVLPKVLKQWNGSNWNILFSLDATTLEGHAANYFKQAFSENNAFNKSFGSAAGSVCQGNDSRLSNARMPVSHNNTYHSEIYATRSDLWRDTTSNQTTNVFFQSGTGTFYWSTGLTVTFDLAYTVVPRVISGANTALMSVSAVSVSTTGFSGQSINWDGSHFSSVASWIAIGRRD